MICRRYMHLNRCTLSLLVVLTAFTLVSVLFNYCMNHLIMDDNVPHINDVMRIYGHNFSGVFWPDSTYVKLNIDEWGDRPHPMLQSSNAVNRTKIEEIMKQFPTGDCVKGLIQDKMEAVMSDFDRRILDYLVLRPGYKSWYSMKQLKKLNSGLPFHFTANDEKVVDQLLEKMPDKGVADLFPLDKCLRCIIMGNSGLLNNSKLGSQIDDYDVVIRLNSGPVKGYETDVGSKTTIRIAYPESSFTDPGQFDPDAIFLFVAFKNSDLQWLKMVTSQERIPMYLKYLSFWKSVAGQFDKPLSQVFIMSPIVQLLTAYQQIGIARRSTTGVLAITFSMYFCDHIDIAGFGYGPKIRAHYYGHDDFLDINSDTNKTVHDEMSEKAYILKLLHFNIIEKDLSGLYADEAKILYGK